MPSKKVYGKMFRLRISIYFVFTLRPQDQFSTLLFTLSIRNVLVHTIRLILSTVFLENLSFEKKRGKRGFLRKRGKRGGVGSQPDLYPDPHSSTPIIQGPTKFRTSMVNYYEFLKSMFFWPRCKHTHKQTIFSHDPPYSRGNINTISSIRS